MAYFVLAIKGQVRISSVAGPATMVPALGELGSVFGLILSCVLIPALNYAISRDDFQSESGRLLRFNLSFHQRIARQSGGPFYR